MKSDIYRNSTREFIQTIKIYREDQDEKPHNAAFHQGQHSLLGLKQYWDKEIKFKLEIITSYPVLCTMNALISSERTHHKHYTKGY